MCRDRLVHEDGGVRIVSVNAWGGAMYDALAAYLPQVDADVVALQEVTRTPGLRGWTRFEDRDRVLPQRADLMADVADVLPDHEPWFTVSDTGPVIADGRSHRQDFGLAILTRRSFVRIASREAFVHGSYTDHGDAWPHSDRPRAAQVTRLRAPDGRTFVLGHLHGLRDAAGKADTPARLAQAKRFAEIVDSVREPGDVVVVCGDLNVLPDSQTFAILADLGVTDLVGSSDTRTTRYTKPVRHASYLLVSEPAAVRGFQIVTEPEVSDHRVLLVDL
jgi:endonuclease/exonuclease/phosphatase family metal-dependent hydrolase